MRIVCLILIIFVLLFVSTLAQTETKCDLSAFVSDSISGVNIRAGAGKDFRIVKTVPKDEGRTMFDVTGAKSDWLRVAYAVNSKNENVFSGDGWVLASLLSVKLGGAETLRDGRLKVYKSPNKTSGLIPFSDFGIELPLQGCQGDWVKVWLPAKGTNVSQGMTGWLLSSAYCGNPWQECD